MGIENHKIINYMEQSCSVKVDYNNIVLLVFSAGGGTICTTAGNSLNTSTRSC